MTTIYEVLVDGKVTLTVPGEIDSNGVIWGNTSSGRTPLVNGFLLEKAGINKSEVGKCARAGRWPKTILDCCMTLGENPGGRLVRNKTASDKQEAARREAEMTPAQRERREIGQMFAKAQRCDRSQDDVEFHHLRGKAEARFQQWKTDFPAEWNHEQAQELRWLASEERRKAQGAFLFDCDGWDTPASQQARHDSFIAEALKMEQRAFELDGLRPDDSDED